MSKAQSHVVGVAVMLGVTVIALGTITAGIGTVFDAHAARADATRVADGFASALEPVETTGPQEGTVSFGEGNLETADRELRIVRNGSRVATIQVDAFIYRQDRRRVAAVAGGIVRGRQEGAWLRRSPPIVATPEAGVLAVGAVKLNASHVATGGGGRVTLASNVTHQRTSLGPGTYTVELETGTPDAFERYFRASNASVSRLDRDGDGIPSVVAQYPGERTAYLVVHDLHLEVSHG